MKSNSYPHTHMMTLKEWKRFVKNYAPIRNEDKKRSIGEYLLKYRYDFDAFILYAFHWPSSPEGDRYWSKINDRTKPVNNGKE